MTHFSTAAKRLLTGAASVIFWIAVWEITSLIVDRELLIASPLRVFWRLTELVRKPVFWSATVASMIRITVGYMIGAVTAVVLSSVSAKVKIVEILSAPLLTVIKTTPIASFIILALVWIKTPLIPVFIVFLIVLPIMWGNMAEGIRAVDKDLKDMVKVYRFTAWKRLTKLYVPSLKPYIKSGALTAIGLGWKSGIAAEVLCLPKDSIGRHLYESKVYLETVDLFAWTVVVIVMSLVLEKIIKELISNK